MERNYRLIVHEDAKSPVAEAYRVLRTNLQFCQTDTTIKKILFSSVGPNEGKSTTIANTAVALAQTGKRVVLVDCDLRKPVQHKIFQLDKNGVTNFLAQGAELNTLLQQTQVPNLTVLASGPIPPNPSELLGADKMKQLLAHLAETYDYVLVDAPPVIAVTDAAVLSASVDGVVLVLDSGSVKPEMAQQAKQLLAAARARILGVILNRVEIEEEHSYYYYYYGSEQEQHSGRKGGKA